MAFDLKYLGHSGFEIRTLNSIILIDPFLQPEHSFDYKNLEVSDILLTHGHLDHVGNSIDIAKDCRSKITAIFELANLCAQKGVKTKGVNFGSWIKYDWGKILYVPAFHSSNYEGVYAGEPAGIIIDIQGIVIYHAGDTNLFTDMKLIRELYSPTIAMLPVGGQFTMDIEHAAIAAQWLNADITIPIHYNTFDAINIDISDFEMIMQTKNLSYQILEPYETLVL